MRRHKPVPPHHEGASMRPSDRLEPRRWWSRHQIGITAAPTLPMRRTSGDRADATYRRLLQAFAALILVIIGLMLVLLIIQSSLAWRTFGFGFITGRNWAPPFKQFGALPYIYGTVVTATMALILAAPIGVGCAIFVTELAPPRVPN